jgi:putative ABC transport system permease protein
MKTKLVKEIFFSLKESLKMSLYTFATNKVRAMLSLLGITIGIFAIISVFTVLDSMENSIRNSVKSLGNDVIYIQKWPWSFESDYPWWEYIKRPEPKFADFENIHKNAKTVELSAFSIMTERKIEYNDVTVTDAPIWSGTPEMAQIRALEVSSGRFFSTMEESSGRKVCIIGQNIVNELFKEKEALESEINIDGHKTRVVGIFKKEGNGMLGRTMDDIVFIPLSYAKNIIDIKSNWSNPQILIKAKAGVSLDDMKDEAQMLMRKSHRLKPGQKDDFALNQASLISSGLDKIFAIINLTGWIIGGFSILVGGFGIANIMFVSVKERTNQIGIQKALGAKNYFILMEFLFESVMLAIVGGVIGLLLVFAGTQVISALTDFDLTLTAGNIVRGLSISSIIGIVSGFIPAWTASKLNPVEAISSTF